MSGVALTSHAHLGVVVVESRSRLGCCALVGFPSMKVVKRFLFSREASDESGGGGGGGNAGGGGGGAGGGRGGLNDESRLAKPSNFQGVG